MHNLAFYMAGDKNIVRSAIITFSSIRKYNGNYPCYIFLDREKLSDMDMKLLEKNNIIIPAFSIEHNFSSSQKWPSEVFWNYKAPKILYQMGYDFSIKLDNDILCKKKLDLEKILPFNDGWAGIDHGDRVDSYINKDREFYISEFMFSPEQLERNYTNVGMLSINNKSYIENNIWEKIIEYYDRITQKRSADIFFADQALFSFVECTSDGFTWKKIGEENNYMLHWLSRWDKQKEFDNASIVHYTGLKPWQRINKKWFRRHPYILKYRIEWQEFVINNKDFNWDLTLKEDKKAKKKSQKNLRSEKILLNSPIFKIWGKIWQFKHKKRGNI